MHAMHVQRNPMVWLLCVALLFGGAAPGLLVAAVAPPTMMHMPDVTPSHHLAPVHLADAERGHAPAPTDDGAHVTDTNAHDCGLQCEGSCQTCAQCHPALASALAETAPPCLCLQAEVHIRAEQTASHQAHRPPIALHS